MPLLALVTICMVIVSLFLDRVDRCIAWKAATGEKRGARPAKLTHAQFAAIRAPESSVQFKLRAPESSVQFKRKCPGANKAGLKF